MRAAPGLIVLALLMIPLGVPLSPWLGSLGASVQRVVPAGSSTEAFAWTFAAVTVAMAAAFLAAGGIGLAGAAFGALRFAFHRSGQLPEGE